MLCLQCKEDLKAVGFGVIEGGYRYSTVSLDESGGIEHCENEFEVDENLLLKIQCGNCGIDLDVKYDDMEDILMGNK